MRVDKRHLKSGKTRLRFKLNESALNTVNRAIKMVGLPRNNQSLEAICLSAITGFATDCKKVKPADGYNRLLFQFFPDEYEVIESALEQFAAGKYTDAQALLLICESYLANGQTIGPPSC